MLIPVVLCGGFGSRLWPLSREHYPKQFLSLLGDSDTLFQSTVKRISQVSHVESPLVVCNARYRFIVAEQLQAIGTDPSAILLEPVGRNTAPAIAIAAFQALEQDESAVLLVLPSDHLLKDDAIFARTVEGALPFVEAGKLVTFGIVPTEPETGYGYIHRGGEISRQGSTAFSVDQFVEKPDLTSAQQYCFSQEYYWNSGIFMFSAKRILEELTDKAPDVFRVCREAFQNRKMDLDFCRIDAEYFSKAPDISIDYAVMEKTEDAVVIPMHTDWSDVGCWEALSAIESPDQSGNVIHGDVVTEATQNSYLRASHRLLTTVGVNDLIVVETPDAVLVSDRHHAQAVKQLVEKLKESHRKEVYDDPRHYRPWGYYEVLSHGKNFQVRRLVIKPRKHVSLHLHHFRAEHWVVIQGTASITRGDDAFELSQDESIFVSMGETHRIENQGNTNLEILEVQTGETIHEEDIGRL